MEKFLDDICEVILNKKGFDVKVLNVHDVTLIANYFILCSAVNTKQAQSIADEVEDKIEEDNVSIIRKEGYREGRWILIDTGDILVHIFVKDERQHYDLDRLWDDAPVIYENAGK